MEITSILFFFLGTFFNTHKEHLDGKISGIEENEPEFFYQSLSPISQNNSYITETDNHSNNSMPTFQEWFDEINDSSKDIAEANNDESEKNDLENKDFVKYLTKLTKTIVLWSGLSTPYFSTPNRATSANVESYFGILKKSLNDIIPCRVDEFVCGHIAMMDGMTKEASQDYIEFIDASGGLQNIVVSTELDYDTDDELNSQCDANNDQFIDDGNDKAMEIDSTQTTCIACNNGHFPGDAHKCIKCSKAVHILEGCSLPCNAAEGYGEVRICIACDAKDKLTKISSKQLNQKEKWARSKRQSKSYLESVPNWNLDKKAKNATKIAMLSNASLSTTTYKIDNSGKKSAPRNTCASDTICQVLYFKIKFIVLTLH